MYFVHYVGGGESWAHTLVHAQKDITSFWRMKGDTSPADACVSLRDLAQLREGKQAAKGR